MSVSAKWTLKVISADSLFLASRRRLQRSSKYWTPLPRQREFQICDRCHHQFDLSHVHNCNRTFAAVSSVCPGRPRQLVSSQLSPLATINGLMAFNLIACKLLTELVLARPNPD